VRFMQFKSVALLLAHGARDDQVAKDGTTIDKLISDVAPEVLKDLPADVDAFVKRHQSQWQPQIMRPSVARSRQKPVSMAMSQSSTGRDRRQAAALASLTVVHMAG